MKKIVICQNFALHIAAFQFVIALRRLQNFFRPSYRAVNRTLFQRGQRRLSLALGAVRVLLRGTWQVPLDAILNNAD